MPNALKRGRSLPRAYLAVKLESCYTYTYIQNMAPCVSEHFLIPEIYVNQHQALVIDQHRKVVCNGMSSKTEAMERCNAMLDATHGR